jgi:hypothetical protein
LTVRDLNESAKMQSGRLRCALGSDARSQPAFVLAQAAKLAKEVGELQAEVLGHAGCQRRAASKSRDHGWVVWRHAVAGVFASGLVDIAGGWGVCDGCGRQADLRG